jgi:hypothetical protein
LQIATHLREEPVTNPFEEESDAAKENLGLGDEADNFAAAKDSGGDIEVESGGDIESIGDEGEDSGGDIESEPTGDGV